MTSTTYMFCLSSFTIVGTDRRVQLIMYSENRSCLRIRTSGSVLIEGALSDLRPEFLERRVVLGGKQGKQRVDFRA
jgi:hypothetical protein